LVKREKLGTYWDGLPLNNLTKEGDVQFPNGKKPEALIQKIFDLATNPGDLVLDSFLGSGTTAAVAMKMRRRFIGIELGDQAVSHCRLRLKNVVSGEQGGVSKAQNWTGGGGFRFWRLGPPVFDETGRISDGIAFATLAAHVWFSETSTPLDPKAKGPLLGVHGNRAVALLYNGVLGDKRPDGGNVLIRQTLAIVREALPVDFDGDLIVYGERSALTPATLAREHVAFKQTPYDVKARR
jgi:adenine-specific DNA-methyltransferase